MQRESAESSLSQDPRKTADDQLIEEQSHEPSYVQSSFIPQQRPYSQYGSGNEGDVVGGQEIGQGPWPVPMQPFHPQSFSHRFDQMHLMMPGSTPAGPVMTPQYTRYQPNITPQPSQPQYYGGQAAGNMYNMNNPRYGAAFSQDHTPAHSDPYLPAAYNTSASASASTSTSRQQMRSPRQQFSDTLRRGVQNFAYQPTGGSSSTGALKSPTSSQGTALLPARPDSAIRASQAMEDEARIANDNMPNRDVMISIPPQNFPGLPRPAPTIPLHSRFPPLPPKPGDEADAKILRDAFEKREDALVLRVEAIGFQPEAAWRFFQEKGDEITRLDEVPGSVDAVREAPAPILGIRLLQKLDQIQRENEELHQLFIDKMAIKTRSSLPDNKGASSRHHFLCWILLTYFLPSQPDRHDTAAPGS